MKSATPEMLAEELNIAAEYAGCGVEFGVKRSCLDGCCFVTWGPSGAPHEQHTSQKEVSTRLAFGRTKGLPDKATWEDFAELLTWATPELGPAKVISFASRSASAKPLRCK